MANALKKTPDANGVYAYIENIINPLDYPSSDWEYSADVSGLSGVDRNYWIYNGTADAKCSEMNQTQKDAVDLALAGVPVEEGQVFTDLQTYAPDEAKDIYLPMPLGNNVVHVMDPNVSQLVGATLVSPNGTGYDPGNVSTGELLINNGNHADLVYNNSSTGNTPGIVYMIDMGTQTSVSGMRRCDYSASYYDTEWQFIGTNNDLAVSSPTLNRFTTGYDVIFTHTQTSANLAATEGFFKAFSAVNYRYYGVRCVTSFNATYSILTELELYSGGSLLTVEKKLSVGQDYEFIKIDDSHVSIQNLSADTKQLKTIVMGTA